MDSVDLDEVELGSRNERPMTRYFPELVAAVTAELPERCVIDGGIIIATDHGLDFEALQTTHSPSRFTSRCDFDCERGLWMLDGPLSNQAFTRAWCRYGVMLRIARAT